MPFPSPADRTDWLRPTGWCTGVAELL